MINDCYVIYDKLKIAYKESAISDNAVLQDILLDLLTDVKVFCNDLNNEKDIVKTKRYTNEQIKGIVKILLLLAKEIISRENAEIEILKISDRFPVHSLSQYKRAYQDALKGIGRYGFAFPSNWAKALIEETNKDPLVIQALRKQMDLYFSRNGKVNNKLKILLDSQE